MGEYQEPFLPERLDRALELARRVLANKIETLKDLNMAFRVVISDHYGIPLFDKYYDGKTLDQLAFEAFFIRERSNTGAENVSKAINDNLDEAAKVVEDEFAAFENLSEPTAEEKARFEKFFQSGKFEGES